MPRSVVLPTRCLRTFAPHTTVRLRFCHTFAGLFTLRFYRLRFTTHAVLPTRLPRLPLPYRAVYLLPRFCRVLGSVCVLRSRLPRLRSAPHTFSAFISRLLPRARTAAAVWLLRLVAPTGSSSALRTARTYRLTVRSTVRYGSPHRPLLACRLLPLYPRYHTAVPTHLTRFCLSAHTVAAPLDYAVLPRLRLRTRGSAMVCRSRTFGYTRAAHRTLRFAVRVTAVRLRLRFAFAGLRGYGSFGSRCFGLRGFAFSLHVFPFALVCRLDCRIRFTAHGSGCSSITVCHSCLFYQLDYQFLIVPYRYGCRCTHVAHTRPRGYTHVRARALRFAVCYAVILYTVTVPGLPFCGSLRIFALPFTAVVGSAHCGCCTRLHVAHTHLHAAYLRFTCTFTPTAQRITFVVHHVAYTGYGLTPTHGYCHGCVAITSAAAGSATHYGSVHCGCTTFAVRILPVAFYADAVTYTTHAAVVLPLFSSARSSPYTGFWVGSYTHGCYLRLCRLLPCLVHTHAPLLRLPGSVGLDSLVRGLRLRFALCRAGLRAVLHRAPRHTPLRFGSVLPATLLLPRFVTHYRLVYTGCLPVRLPHAHRWLVVAIHTLPPAAHTRCGYCRLHPDAFTTVLCSSHTYTAVTVWLPHAGCYLFLRLCSLFTAVCWILVGCFTLPVTPATVLRSLYRYPARFTIRFWFTGCSPVTWFAALPHACRAVLRLLVAVLPTGYFTHRSSWLRVPLRGYGCRFLHTVGLVPVLRFPFVVTVLVTQFWFHYGYTHTARFTVLTHALPRSRLFTCYTRTVTIWLQFTFTVHTPFYGCGWFSSGLRLPRIPRTVTRTRYTRG